MLQQLADALPDSYVQRLSIEFNRLPMPAAAPASAAAPTVSSGGAQILTISDPANDGKAVPGLDLPSRPGTTASTASISGNNNAPASARLAGGLDSMPEEEVGGDVGDKLASLASRIAASPDCVFAQFASPDSPLVSLTLRADGITSTGATALFEMLAENRSLMVCPSVRLLCLNVRTQALNLWENEIGDEAIGVLATLLLSNRVVTAVSLARNRISDAGAIALSHSFRAVPVDKVCADSL